MWRALELPAYRRLLAAYTLGEIGWSFGTVALSLLVYRRTGSAAGATAFFICAGFIPALLSPWLVARVDQLPPGGVLPVLYGGEAVLFALLAWLVGHFAVAPVLAVALLDGVLALSARSLARATTVTALKRRGLLREGNALTNISFSVVFMVGPAAGGAVVALGGTRAALVVDVGVFAAMAIVLGTASLPRPEAVGERAAGRLRAAVAHAASRARVRGWLVYQGCAVFFFMMATPVIVVFAQHTLHAGAGGYGGLLSAWGGGAVLGSGVYARARSAAARTLTAVGSAAVGLGLVAMAIAPSLVPALAAAAVGGIGNGIESIAARTGLQEQVREEWMARIMSLYDSLIEALPGLGFLVGGAVTALAGSRTALVVAGAGALATTAAIGAIVPGPAGSGGPATDP
jgi:hypothetical protein